MNDQKQAKLVNRCLDMVIRGIKTEEECITQYPFIKDSLYAAFKLQKYSALEEKTGFSTTEISQKRRKLISRLPERLPVVTKTENFRYAWQNTKRRFAMTWIIIVTTLVSLVTGAGVAYASNDALPSETLYPVKLFVESAQLGIAPDEVDARLHLEFATHRLEEVAALGESGDINLQLQTMAAYENQMRLMQQAAEKVGAGKPESANRLRTQLETEMRTQTQLIESLLSGTSAEIGDRTRERLRAMLETSTQTQLRIQQTETDTEPVIDQDVTPEIVETSEPANQIKNQNQNRNMVVNGPEQTLDQNKLFFRFQFQQPIQDGVFAESGGKRYPCEAVDSTVVCDVTGLPGQGQLNLYHLATEDLLYMYDYNHNYEYLWAGTKEAGGTEYQGGENQPQDNAGGAEQGRNGKNQ